MATSITQGYDGTRPEDITLNFTGLLHDANVSDYGYLPFPVSYLSPNSTQFQQNISISFVNKDDFIVKDQQLSLNDVLVKAQHATMPNLDNPKYHKKKTSGILDIVTGSLSVLAGIGVSAATESPAGAGSIISGISSIITGSAAVAGHPSDPAFQRFKEIVKLETDILNVVYQNHALLEENHNLILQLGVEVDKAVVIILNAIQNAERKTRMNTDYTTMRTGIDLISRKYKCWQSLPNVTDSWCCTDISNVGICESDLVKDILDGTTTDDFKSAYDHIFNFATGINKNDPTFPPLDPGLLQLYAQISYDANHSTTSYENHNDYLWRQRYLSLAYSIENTLKQAARLFVWATSHRYAPLAKTTKYQWMNRSRDLLSFSSFITAQFPPHIKAIFLPNISTYTSQYHFAVNSSNLVSNVTNETTVSYKNRKHYLSFSEKMPSTQTTKCFMGINSNPQEYSSHYGVGPACADASENGAWKYVFDKAEVQFVPLNEATALYAGAVPVQEYQFTNQESSITAYDLTNDGNVSRIKVLSSYFKTKAYSDIFDTRMFTLGSTYAVNRNFTTLRSDSFGFSMMWPGTERVIMYLEEVTESTGDTTEEVVETTSFPIEDITESTSIPTEHESGNAAFAIFSTNFIKLDMVLLLLIFL